MGHLTTQHIVQYDFARLGADSCCKDAKGDTLLTADSIFSHQQLVGICISDSLT